MRVTKVIICLLFICQQMSAQFLGFNIRSGNQSLIEDAVSDCILQVKQSYILCDTLTKEKFGSGDNDYFSVISSVGIKTERGLIVGDDAITPWDSDPDFKRYKGKYIPELSQTAVFSMNGDEINLYSRDSFLSPKMLLDTEYYLCHHDDRIATGLKCDTIKGEKKGMARLGLF